MTPARIGPALVVAVLASSCRCGKVPAPAAEEGGAAPIPTLRDVLCGTRSPCRLVKETPLAASARILATVALSDAGDQDAGDDDIGCVPVESWLASKRGPSFVREQLLVTDCTRKPTAEWPWELKVTGDVARYELDGQDVPSTWVGTTWAEISLAPPRLLAEGASYWNRLQPCPQEEVENREGGFLQNVHWRMASRCDAPDTCTAARALAFVALPRVKLPAAYEASSWRTTELGSCAAVVDGTKDHGFVTFGKTTGPADASMRVVLSDAGVLYVDVRDDHFTSRDRSEKWVKADHVEIWLAPSALSYMTACVGPVDKPTQWGVALADGAVFVGARGTDAPAVPTAERAESGGVVHLRVALPLTGADSLTVAYSDSDDGQTQKSIVATSKIVFGRLETLGRVATVTQSSCAVSAGRLDAVPLAADPSKRLWPTEPE